MTRWSLFLQTLSLLHHFLGLYYTALTALELLCPHYDNVARSCVPDHRTS